MSDREGHGLSSETIALGESIMRDSGARWALTALLLSGCVALVSVLGAAHWTDTVILATVTALAAMGLPIRWRLATAALAWALLTGFIIHRFGDLSFLPADLERLAVFAASALLVGFALGDRRSER